MSRESPRPSLAFASAQFLFARAYFAVLSYVVVVLIARGLGREVFGRYVVVMAVLAWTEVVTTALTMLVINRAARGLWGEVRGILARQRAIAVGAAVSMAVFAVPLSILFRDRSLAFLFCVAALDIVPYSFFMANQGLLNGLERYRQQVIVNMVYPTGKLVLMGGGVLLFPHPAAPLAGMALASLAAWLTGVAFLRAGATREKMTRLRAARVERPREVGTTLVAIGSQWLFLSLDVWFLQWLGAGAAVLGEYGAAQNVAKLLYMASGSLAGPVVPAIAKAGRLREALASDRQLRRVVEFIAVSLLLGVAFLFVAAPWLVRLMFGAKFGAGAGFLRWLAVGYGLLVPGLLTLNILYHTRRSALSATLAVVGALAYSPVAYVFTRQLGPGGAGAALGVVGLFFLVGGPLLGRRMNVVQRAEAG